MNFIKKSWKGILLCIGISIPAWFLGQLFPVIGGPVIAIVIGMVLTLLIKDKSGFEGGIQFTSKKILQCAVVLLGFGLNLNVILETGIDVYKRQVPYQTEFFGPAAFSEGTAAAPCLYPSSGCCTKCPE